MATDLSDIVKQGYLRYKSRSLGLWQKRWFVLRSTSNKGPARLEKYLDENAARHLEQHKVQLLTNVCSLTRLPQSSKKHAFVVNFHDGSNKYFSCDSDLEANNWVKLASQECFLGSSSSIANGEPDVLKPGIQKELQEQFRVYLMPSSKLDVFGECLLQVTHENIYLWDMVNSKLKLCAWPLTALRRYGSDLTKFTFEAGRHCATGEGMFVFHTLEGEKIYRKVHQATLTIAEAHQRMKRHTLRAPNSPSPKEAFHSLRCSTRSSLPMRHTSLEETSVQPDDNEEHTSWYHSDDESDITAAASEAYSNRRHLDSQFSLDQSAQLLQTAN